jgi:tRNA-specific 2-thiouridylase
MKVAVGMSGGVDSSVAAALLKEQGHDVVGICMKLWDGTPLATGPYHACYGPDEVMDIEDAQQVAAFLEIPFHVIDLTREYQSTILDYFKKEYLAGRTPNPCIKCNQKIKFKQLLAKAQRSGVGFDYFATGHYARVAFDQGKSRYLLKKAHDRKKDQSYWLAFLSQEQLSKVCFPLGDYTKQEVRKKASVFGLNTHDKPDSQDFFSGDYKELINVPAHPGPIVDRKGTVLGTHEGIWLYTIGQRKGLGIAARKPLYVIAIDEEKNAVVVGNREELAHRGLIAQDVNFIGIDSISQPMKVTMKIRYAQEPFEGILYPPVNDSVHVTFQEPQLAVTPGQAVVFYDEDCVVGGGIIEKSEK